MSQTRIVESLVVSLEKDTDWDVRKTAADALRGLLPKTPAELRNWVNTSLSLFEREYEIHQQELDDDDGC